MASGYKTSTERAEWIKNNYFF